MSLRHAAATMVGTLALFTASPAWAQVSGPVYPPPGGVTFSTNGVSTIQSGRVATYQDFDLSATDQLYFGLTSTGLAMDGAINELGENLLFDATLSDLANGYVVYSGLTQVNSFGTDQTIYTRLALTFADLLTANPLSLTINPLISLNPVLNVQGGFTLSGGFTSSYSQLGTYTASGPFFNAVPGTSPTPQQLRSSLGGGFYFTENAAVPEPSTWAMMLFGFGAVGYSMRRRRKVGRLPQAA